MFSLHAFALVACLGILVFNDVLDFGGDVYYGKIIA
jgi:hypothetical protein